MEKYNGRRGNCRSVRLREVSVLWDVRLKRFHCTSLIEHIILHIGKVYGERGCRTTGTHC